MTSRYFSVIRFWSWVSSAHRWWPTLYDSIVSVTTSVYAINFSGPRTDPAATLKDNWTGPTESDEVWNDWVRVLMYNWNQFSAVSLTQKWCYVTSINTNWSTVSEAAVRTNSTKTDTSPSSIALAISLDELCNKATIWHWPARLYIKRIWRRLFEMRSDNRLLELIR